MKLLRYQERTFGYCEISGAFSPIFVWSTIFDSDRSRSFEVAFANEKHRGTDCEMDRTVATLKLNIDQEGVMETLTRSQDGHVGKGANIVAGSNGKEYYL